MAADADITDIHSTLKISKILEIQLHGIKLKDMDSASLPLPCQACPAGGSGMKSNSIDSDFPIPC